jgi:hypothetical protein
VKVARFCKKNRHFLFCALKLSVCFPLLSIKELFKMKRTLLAVATLAALSLSNYSQASIVEADWLSTGDNLAVLDTNSNLEWIDLSQTQNDNYSGVVSKLNGIFTSWRLPSVQEVAGLFSSAFTTYGANAGFKQFGPSTSSHDDATDFSRIFNSDGGDQWTLGLFQDGGEYKVTGVMANGEDYRVLDSTMNAQSGAENQIGIVYSTFLVRNASTSSEPETGPGPAPSPSPQAPVDVSAPIGLAALMLSGFAFLRRRKSL